MEGMGFIIAAALLFGLIVLGLLLWSFASSQYDDLDGDAVRILLDDEDAP
ncbi:MAG TPA: cbb3-type cytochrome oxidase assembly protein CcoS [Rhizomicrobium sp.]|nr:cbb3-type cytochrome oxidase assembly protein CcoS [Rhizomicrobium sp.]